MKQRQKWTALFMATVMLLSQVGCQKEGDRQQTGQKNAKDTIVIATSSETPTLSFAEHNTTAANYMNTLTYEGLLRLDMEMQPQPCLAESYESMSDTVWRFYLREGVLYHNGDTMTAEDVKASLEYAQQFAEVSAYTSEIKSVTVVDEYTVDVETLAPSASILDNLSAFANSIVPKQLIDNGHDFNTSPIGTGPYVFQDWKRGDQLEFEAFDDYWNGKPAIQHMVWKIIPEGSARTIALEAGEVDMVIEVESVDVPRLRENQDITLVEYEEAGINFLNLNNKVPGLDNEAVRHAINCAINKENVIEVAQSGLGEVADSQVPMTLLGASDENADHYDVEKAKEWMEKSGVDPSTIELSILCSNDARRRAAEVIQADLREIGIEATIESTDLATFFSLLTDGNFTGAIGGYNDSNLAMYLKGVYHTDSNKFRLTDPEIDAMIDDALTTVDQNERETKLQKLCAVLNERCSIVPLWQPVGLRAFHHDLQGVEVNGRGTIYFQDVSWA